MRCDSNNNNIQRHCLSLTYVYIRWSIHPCHLFAALWHQIFSVSFPLRFSSLFSFIFIFTLLVRLTPDVCLCVVGRARMWFVRHDMIEYTIILRPRFVFKCAVMCEYWVTQTNSRIDVKRIFTRKTFVRFNINNNFPHRQIQTNDKPEKTENLSAKVWITIRDMIHENEKNIFISCARQISSTPYSSEHYRMLYTYLIAISCSTALTVECVHSMTK